MNWISRFAPSTMLLCMAFLTGQVAARPAAETGARMPGSLISTNADGMHTCAVKEDGTVRCWGFNSAGQLVVIIKNEDFVKFTGLTIFGDYRAPKAAISGAKSVNILQEIRFTK